jgi:hypothetical protein
VSGPVVVKVELFLHLSHDGIIATHVFEVVEADRMTAAGAF